MEYLEMPYKEWDGKTPLTLFNDDKFFFDEDDIEYHLEEINSDIENSNNHVTIDKLQLVIASPNKLWELDFNDIYCDILPEDRYIDDVGSKELTDAMEAINKIIKTHDTVSWSYGKHRTTLIA